VRMISSWSKIFISYQIKSVLSAKALHTPHFSIQFFHVFTLSSFACHSILNCLADEPLLWDAPSPTLTGLYFKLHGTHRPNSMKKTVIKRRKRVPAAGVSPGRMSDQAAAEALVAVGRIGGHGSGGGGDDDSDGEVAEQPRKKRSRKSVGKNGKEKGGNGRRRGENDDDGDDGEGGIDEDGEPRRKKSRDGWADVTGPSLSVSPRLDHQQRPHQNPDPYGHLRGGQFLGSPHHHSGFDLPPLAAIGGDRDRNAYGPYNPAMASHFPAAPSSYIRSGSNAPSRTHSPLNQGGLGGGPGQGYALPPPHQLMHTHGGGGGGYYPGMGQSPGSHDPPPSVMAGLMGMGMGMGLPPPSSSPSGIPSVGELERHYYQLSEQKRSMEEMLERTDRMMIGVKRGLDEMKAGQLGEEMNGSGVGVGATVPLNRPSSREKERRDIWPTTDPSTRD
jgi:GATA-binding protein, other eukaryote